MIAFSTTTMGGRRISSSSIYGSISQNPLWDVPRSVAAVRSSVACILQIRVLDSRNLIGRYTNSPFVII